MARVPYVSRDDLPPDKRHVYDSIRRIRHGAGGLARSFRALLNSPDAAGAVGALGDYIVLESPLDPGLREVAILCVGYELDNPYVWAHHEGGARKAGVSEEVITAIKDGTPPTGLPAKEAVIAQATKELVVERTMTDPTFQAVLQLLGVQHTVDLVVVVGFYSMLSGAIKALGVELEPHYERTQAEAERRGN